MRMRWPLLFVLAVTVLAGVGWGRPALAANTAESVTDSCALGTLPSGAASKICVPSAWNGDLVIWAHGYVFPGDAPTFQDELADGTRLPDLIQSLGYAFATTTYRANGLVVREGQEDILQLRKKFKRDYPGFSGRIYLTGASMGGLITTLLAENNPGKFDGALAACGIVGDFRRHTNYWGDFRVLFDYFFPGVLPAPPPSSTAGWAPYTLAIAAAVERDPDAARQLIAVSGAPVDLSLDNPALGTIQTLLAYSVLSQENAIDQLGGQPFDNQSRIYAGSDDDAALNAGVERITADPAALMTIRRYYETSGRIRIPIVMPHTTGDEVVPFDQTLTYLIKARASGKMIPIPIERFGHCSFTTEEVTLSFGLLVYKVTGQLPPVFPAEAAQLETRR